MGKFTCPVANCDKELTRLQVMHFRAEHDCDPAEWVEKRYGQEIESKYSAGRGCDAIAKGYEWLSSDMVYGIVESRSHDESMTGHDNPMKRKDVVAQFTGKSNPSKRPKVREKISDALAGHTVSEETREKISEKNRNNTISEQHRRAVSIAASEMDRSYMQTEEYSRTVSRSLRGRSLTHPEPYAADELTHTVRSSWEEDIAKLLIENEISYSYEDEFVLSKGSYYPDFITEECVIEVKGWSNDRSIKKADWFMEEFPEYKYVVVGAEIPCDVHIPWEDRRNLVKVIKNG